MARRSPNSNRPPRIVSVDVLRGETHRVLLPPLLLPLQSISLSCLLLPLTVSFVGLGWASVFRFGLQQLFRFRGDLRLLNWAQG